VTVTERTTARKSFVESYDNPGVDWTEKTVNNGGQLVHFGVNAL